ncbi:hypothetical protein C8J57DRAFT_1626051 [Mycena rebaudengoi]|nr:hypothetical protein C8J57DRAFT_1626051 [Mycena rebaudengoi]
MQSVPKDLAMWSFPIALAPQKIDARRPNSAPTAYKENEDAEAAKIAKMEKEIAKYKKQQNLQKKSAQKNKAGSDDDEPESEERSDNEGGPAVFSSAITPLGRLPAAAPRPPVVLRKSNKATTQTKTQRRSLLLVPQPAAASAEDQDDEVDDWEDAMDIDDERQPPNSSSSRSSVSPRRHHRSYTPSRGRRSRSRSRGQGSPGGNRSCSRDRVPVRSPPRRVASPVHRSRSSPHRGRSHERAPVSSPQRSTSQTGSLSRRTTSPARTPGPEKRRTPPSRSPPPAAKRTKAEAAKFADNFKAGSRPKAADYEDIVQALLIRAMAEYSVYILTVYAFPDTDMQKKWIKKRGSQIRGVMVTMYRSLFASHYGFKRSSAAAAIKDNIERHRQVSDCAAFHYKNVKDRTGFASNKIIAEVRHLTSFKDKQSLGAIFPSYFNPISLPSLALDFTLLEHLTSEWSTGAFIKADFTEKDASNSYRTHLTDIETWSSYSKDVIETIRRRWYTNASRNIGVAMSSEKLTHIDHTQEDSLRAELEGRTGATDSESEPEEATAEQPDAAVVANTGGAEAAEVMAT